MMSLTERLKKFRDERDWQQFHTPKDLALSLSVETAELLELFQWRPEDEELDDYLKQKLESEVADVFSYLLLLCDRAGIDLEEATNKKIDLNEERFPVSVSRGVAKPGGEN